MSCIKIIFNKTIFNMKTKIEKSIKFLAAGVFLFALAFNVVVTLDDPFALMSDEVIAESSRNTSSSCSCDSCCNYGTSYSNCTACCDDPYDAVCDYFGCSCD